MQLLNHFTVSAYLDYFDACQPDSQSQSELEFNGIQNLVLGAVHRAGKHGYRVSERLLRHILTAGFVSRYKKSDAIEAYASGNSRMQFVLMKNQRYWDGEILAPYEVRSIRERCFFVRIFPMNLMHWVRYWFAKA